MEHPRIGAYFSWIFGISEFILHLYVIGQGALCLADHTMIYYLMGINLHANVGPVNLAI